MVFKSLTHREKKKNPKEAVRTLLRYLGAPGWLVALCEAAANGQGTEQEANHLGELIAVAYSEQSYTGGMARPAAVFDKFNAPNR